MARGRRETVTFEAEGDLLVAILPTEATILGVLVSKSDPGAELLVLWPESGESLLLPGLTDASKYKGHLKDLRGLRKYPSAEQGRRVILRTKGHVRAHLVLEVPSSWIRPSTSTGE